MPKFNQHKIKLLKTVDKLFKFFYLFPRNNKPYPIIINDEVKEIVVIAFLLIGDTVMYIPALRILKKNFPNARITLVGGNLVKDILKDQQLANDFIIAKCPWIAPFDKSIKNILNFFLTVNKVNKKSYDMAIDFRGDWRNIFYMNFIKSIRKISFNFSGGEYMLTDVINPVEIKRHLIDETFMLFQQMRLPFNDDDKFPVLKIENQEDKFFLQNFQKNNGLNNKFIISIHPGASLEERKWDEAKYSELIIRIAKTSSNYVFLIFEGPNENETVSKIISPLDQKKINFLIVSKNLKEYLAIMSCSQILICNDSGAAHLGAAYNIPAIVIFGKGDPTEVKPYSKNILKIVSHELECKPCHLIHCKYGTNLCMKMISVDEVYNNFIVVVETLMTRVQIND